MICLHQLSSPPLEADSTTGKLGYLGLNFHSYENNNRSSCLQILYGLQEYLLNVLVLCLCRNRILFQVSFVMI